MECIVCQEPAAFGCGDCRQRFYCSYDCQSHDLDVGEHMLICAKDFDTGMRDLWVPIFVKLRTLQNPNATEIHNYDDLVKLVLRDSTQKTSNRLAAIDAWPKERRQTIRVEMIKKFELDSIMGMSEVFRLAMQDTLSSDPIIEASGDRDFLLKKLLPEILELLRKVCKESVKFRKVEICPTFSKLRKELKAAQKTEAKAKPKPKPVTVPKPIDLNVLWDKKCTGKAPWYDNAFHLMGAGKVIGEFICKLGLAPMTDKESDVIVMLLTQMQALPGKGILQAILPAKIDDMLQRRLRKEPFELTELESIFSKLMALPGTLSLINSSKGMKSFGINTAETKEAPPPADQLKRTVDLNDWVSRNCTDKQSAICLMQRGYKVGEFLCRLRLLPVQNADLDLIMTIVNGTQAWVDSLRAINPLKHAINLVLSNADYANRRMRRAEPHLNTFLDFAPLFESLKSYKLMGMVGGQLAPYGLSST